MKTIYERAVAVWGEDRQVNQAIEECSEFVVSACHRRRGRHKDIYAFAEEIADNEIMMKQMRLLTPAGLVDQIKIQKLKRLAKRIDAAEKEKVKRTNSFIMPIVSRASRPLTMARGRGR